MILFSRCVCVNLELDVFIDFGCLVSAHDLISNRMREAHAGGGA